MTSMIDPEGVAALAGAEAQVALVSGDLPRAQRLHSEAGDSLLRDMNSVHKERDRHLLRFLAATQYFKGGLYEKAAEVCRKIQIKMLAAHLRPNFEQFERDAKFRMAKGYANDIRRELLRLRQAGKHEQILALLQTHPYAVNPVAKASLQAVTCAEIGDYRAAAAFFAFVFRSAPLDLHRMFAAAAIPLRLIEDRRFGDAWEYSRLLAEIVGHPLLLACASLACFHQSASDDEKLNKQWVSDQILYCKKTLAILRHLPDGHQSDGKLKSFISFSLIAAAIGLDRISERENAIEYANLAIGFDPDNPTPHTLLGMVTLPDSEATNHFREAIHRQDPSPEPFYQVALHCLHVENYSEAYLLCEQALIRQPDHETAAVLLNWKAIATDKLGKPKEEVERLFREALGCDPTNEMIGENYRLFAQAGQVKSNFRDQLSSATLIDKKSLWNENFIRVQESQLSKDISKDKYFELGLAGV